MILSCKDLTYSYINENTLKGVTFHINKGQQTAIIGSNGAGKTTLFKLLTGNLSPESGQVFISNDTSLGYLSQHTDYDSNHNVYEEMYRANPSIIHMKNKLASLEASLANTPNPSEELLHNYHDTIEAFERLDGYSYESRVKGVLNGLSFKPSQYQQGVNTLSGGQKTRLALGKLLLRQPQLLLLDEPTNHLDLAAITWLEGYLKAYKGTLLIISHDRYFLDSIVSKIIDIEYGKAFVYKGNYTDFIEKKEFKKNLEQKQFQRQQSEIKRQEEIIRKLRSYGNEKFIKRAQSREKVLDKMDMVEKPVHLRDNMHLHLHPKRESGNDVLKVEDLKMSFDDLVLFDLLNLDIKKGEKIALIGKNGSGKTSLFKILMNQLKADYGRIKLGTGVELAYYDQEHAELNTSLTLVEEIANVFPNMGMTEIRNMLAAFLFTGDDVFKEVSSLSGGEKGRLSLAKLMLSKGNFLLLDEPTNHLDLISKEVLENALINYSGTLFFISHDRYFINRVATKVVDLENKRLTSYMGNYDYYIEKKSMASESKNIITSPTSQNKTDWKAQKELEKQKRQQKNKIDNIEKTIEDLEQRIDNIDKELAKEEIFSSYEKSNRLMTEKSEIESNLSEAYDIWEQLHQED